MTLTVRLDAATQSALDRYCGERGVTRSLVVQESLALYLLADRMGEGDANVKASSKVPASANHRAFAAAGFIGAGELGGGSADKAAVRALALQRVRRNAE